MNEVKQLRCKAIFDSNIEKINPLFSKVKIRIAYTGANRNNSYISKESFEKALPTIYNCPIIGEFIETVDDFGSHGGKIEISDKGIKYIQTTKPYGVINETSEITWEDVVEEDGTVNTYLCATGYLWTGRYDELFSVIENSKSQSMEIEVQKGEFKDINSKQVYSIDEFIFSAFCILGDSVEPCFESSEITSYNFNKDEFKSEFAKMLDELKQFSQLNQSPSPRVDNIDFKEKEDNKLDEKLELVAKYNLTVEQLNSSIDEISLEELEEKLKEFIKEPKIEFSATYRQKREALQNALDPKIEKDSDGNITYEEYLWVEDFDDSVVFVEKSIWSPDNYERKYGRFAYTFDEEALTATITGEFEEMVLVWLTIDENQKLQDERSDYSKLESDFNEYKQNYSTPNTEVERLQNYEVKKLQTERTEQEEILFSKYDEIFEAEDESYKKIKKEKSNFSIEQLEEKLAVIFARKQLNFSSNKDKNKNIIKLGGDSGNTGEISPYGNLFEKHNVNNNNKEEN